MEARREFSSYDVEGENKEPDFASFLSRPDLYPVHPDFFTEGYDNDNNNLVALAVRMNKFEALDKLLTVGGDPNQLTTRRMFLLSSAAYHGYKNCIITLLEHGGDVNYESESGSTALFQAAHFGF